MNRHILTTCVTLALASVTSAAHAVVIFNENFDVDHTANWTTNSSTGGNNAANYFFDYSTIGVPSAPGSGGTTRGLKLEANFTATTPAATHGISVSPTGFSVTGDFDIRFHAWHNTLGPFPDGGSGSTQLTTYGWGTAGTSAQYHLGRDSIIFGATGEAGATQDYRVYPNAALVADPIPGLLAPSGSSSSAANAFYTTAFPGAAPPAAQTTIAAAAPISYATHTGTTNVGSPAFAWHPVVIAKRANIVTWTMNGLTIASLNTSTQLGAALGGSNFFLGQSDINGTVSSNLTVARALLFGLVDNVVVDQIPEPGSAALLGLATVGLAAARRQRTRRGR